MGCEIYCKDTKQIRHSLLPNHLLLIMHQGIKPVNKWLSAATFYATRDLHIMLK